MDIYKCSSCKFEFNTGFLHLTYCPKCFGSFRQTLGILKVLAYFIIPIIVIMVILKFALPSAYQHIMGVILSVLDISTLFAGSKDAYLDSVLSGGRR